MHTPQENPVTAGELQKRAASPEGKPQRRLKRGKYTPIACEPCKKRKLKCIPGGNNGDCHRCAASDLKCDYRTGPLQIVRNNTENSSEIAQTIHDELKQLSSKVSDLTGTVNELKTRLNSHDVVSPPQSLSTTSTAAARYDGSPRASRQHRAHVPNQPQFVGPTRSAYSFEVGERSLTDMGIPFFDLPPPSGPQSAVGSPADTTSDTDFWQRCTATEISRLLGVFEEEIEPIYPCIDSQTLAASATEIIEYARLDQREQEPVGPVTTTRSFSFKDFQVAQVAIATAIVIECHGRNEDSQTIIESVEKFVSWIPNGEADLKGIQLLAILSIYYFLCDEDLLAWRTIGVAARGALEMGLHRRETLISKFADEETRSTAIRIFWCVYVLDRRWSFGTSLSFALSDRDIDPELPEPAAINHSRDSGYQYLQCMVGYARLSSKLWDALMSFGPSSHTMPDEKATSLDFMTQEWLDTIPPHLQLRHPRLGLGSRAQPRVLQRLRALLYLRGNHTRILIYRHHLLSARHIRADLQTAWLVVEIAQDSVQVLVHLHSTTDIYTRQQSAFNYFLLSALAVIFLAVCHEPTIFAEPCRKAFYAAADLVRDFSRRSKVSRRLWDSIRGLLPRLRRLGMRGADEQPRQVEGSVQRPEMIEGAADSAGENGEGGIHKDGFSESAEYLNQQSLSHGEGLGLAMELPEPSLGGSDDQGLTPNMFQVSNDLMTLFNVIEQNQQFPEDPRPYVQSSSGQDTMGYEESEMWQRFQGLIWNGHD